MRDPHRRRMDKVTSNSKRSPNMKELRVMAPSKTEQTRNTLIRIYDIAFLDIASIF